MVGTAFAAARPLQTEVRLPDLFIGERLAPSAGTIRRFWTMLAHHHGTRRDAVHALGRGSIVRELG